ncbi:MAG: hypothetical protein J6A19_11295 [Oscillospiraceae bacterium]|nr:hypothetical protein [Oscillospiraceae bacterium]
MKKEFRLQNRMSRVQVLLPLPSFAARTSAAKPPIFLAVPEWDGVFAEYTRFTISQKTARKKMKNLVRHYSGFVALS